MTTPPAEPEVRTITGTVRGRREGDLAVFRGIPFAQPPVRELRFAAPQPAHPWDGVREATAFGPPPPQDIVVPGRTGGLSGVATGDDWLTVNVWTPRPDPAARRPVLVWIYGGAYKLGFSGSPGYDAQHLTRAGDHVVVSFNYRVAMEGFAHFEGAPANRGLLDQVAALEWVRDNITAFGGDPDRVTVFGESAGAGSIAALLAMPRAKNLFRQAILQSPPGTFYSDALGRDIGAALAAGQGLRATADDLATVDPHELVGAAAGLTDELGWDRTRWGAVADTITPYSPVVDGDVLPTDPWTALAAGSARDVRIIVGHNRNECRLFLFLGGALTGIDETRATAALRATGPGPAPESAYRAAYPAASPEQLLEYVQSDRLFRMPAIRLAQAQRSAGGTAHVYEITWPAPGNEALGACHGLDGPLVFGTLSAHLGPLLFGPEPSAETRAQSARIQRAWTDFAATGDPGWPAYDTRGLVRVFAAEPATTPYPEAISERLWAAHAFGALPLG
ncbi:carboxylesterase/lipase family protein [Nocardia aurantia]|uniref:Carboxylic ester hydrolase n=1 Tax=Nocardia aurantia TaxID=2585199 RepID=A0A7K0DHQ4_9NOCA|nr:carboxylesterase family protein [Nocardia aurantia]MQY25148.1 Carboxylesterase [Nocardia aurantia]